MEREKRDRGRVKERQTHRQPEDVQKSEGEREGESERQKNIDIHSTSPLIQRTLTSTEPIAIFIVQGVLCYACMPWLSTPEKPGLSWDVG